MSKPNAADLKRQPPSYPEYASDILASHAFKRLDATARGILWTLRMEWWVNGDLPTDPHLLSRLVGLPANELDNALPLFAPFLSINNSTGTFSFPELAMRKASTIAARNAQSLGGKKTARINQERAKSTKGANHSATQGANHSANHSASQGANHSASHSASHGALERVERVERVEIKTKLKPSTTIEISNKTSSLTTCTEGAA